MFQTCPHCLDDFDDARRSTICPHDRFLSEEAMARKDAAIALIGRKIRFAHEPLGPDRRIQSVGWNGMVTIHGFDGEFAPHLFILTETSHE